jgi:glycosyltransferase involved in cell wall biosynthesis
MKPLFIISCPIDTYSGYGARSRDLVKSIIKSDKYDVKVLPQRWGNCPWGFVEDHPKEWGFLLPHLLPPGNQLPKQPEIWAQITVPNEFQRVGKFNIGITAGIETTICHGSWVEGLNRMDLNLVSSNHSKKVFEDMNFEKKDNQGNSLGHLKLEKPVEVIFEGIDLEKFYPSKSKSTIDLSEIKESFAYLFVGHWMQGDLGQDRKNVGLLIKTFYENFKNKKKTPALILKCSGAGASYMDRDFILDKIQQIKKSIEAETLPNIYLLHGEFTDVEINELYNHPKVKAMLSLTKGEGFGRPLLEFSLTKKPILATNWSGHIDFLDKEYTPLVSGELKNVHPSAVVKDVIMEEGKWFDPNLFEVSSHIQNMFVNYKNYTKGAMLQYHKSKNNFNFDKMCELVDSTLTQYLPGFPKELKLNLPKLKKKKLELPKLELPKLK